MIFALSACLVELVIVTLCDAIDRSSVVSGWRTTLVMFPPAQTTWAPGSSVSVVPVTDRSGMFSVPLTVAAPIVRLTITFAFGPTVSVSTACDACSSM